MPVVKIDVEVQIAHPARGALTHRQKDESRRAGPERRTRRLRNSGDRGFFSPRAFDLIASDRML
jgi:hypothetical protein